MNTVQLLPSRAFGAFEIKSYYQKSMSMAIGLAVAFHLAVLGAVSFYSMLGGTTSAGPVTNSGGERTVILQPPPSMTNAEPTVQTTVAAPPVPKIGIPVAVNDAEVVEDVPFATRDDLAKLSGPVDLGAVWGPGDSIVFSAQIPEERPRPGVFVHVEEDPVAIFRPSPEYPEMAVLTERTGSVWVMALVDVTGEVVDARIARESGMNVGFEDAALAAALKSKYKPAIQNGKPIAVWTTYRVDFKLRR